MRSALASLSAITLSVILVQPAAAQRSAFGSAVVASESEVIVGEPSTNFRPGTVYVYRKSGNDWFQAATLTAPDAERADGFGAPLVRDGSTLFVGQGGRFHVYRRSDAGEWQYQSTVGSAEVPGAGAGRGGGGRVAAAAGDILLLGTPGAPQFGRGGGGGRGRGGAGAEPPDPGVVRVLRRDASGGWAEAGQIASPEAAPGDAFGSSIAIADGRAVIGAPGLNDGAGKAFVFRLEAGSGQWVHEGTLEEEELGPGDRFGSAVSLSGDVVVAGAPSLGGGYGGAFVYHSGPDGWSRVSRLAAFDGAPQDRFGSAVGVRGREVWVGAPPQGRGGTPTGSAYVFRLSDDGAGVASTSRLQPSERDEGDGFGGEMALGGPVTAVGAAGADLGAGAVVLFEQSGGSWREAQRLTSPPDALPAMTGEERVCPDGGQIGVFDCEEVDVLGFVPPWMLAIKGRERGVTLNDLWGWTDPETGHEYALVGRVEGTSFVDITDPTHPVLLGDLPTTPGGAPRSVWRDIKVYADHAFIVADAAGPHGVQIFDLRRLRNVANPPTTFTEDAHYDRINSAHNIVINEETGFAYVVGASAGGETCGGGLHMVDVRDPLNPTFAGCFADPETGRRGTGYSHDAQCVVYHGPDTRFTGHEICLGSNENALSVADVTDKSAPVALSRATYPNPAYTHQGWLTDDHRYFFQDDESDEIAGTVDRTRTMVWDLQDLEDPQLALEFMGTSSASDHNLYIKGNLMYQSNYRAGLRIIDISDPLAPKEVGYLDTAPYMANEPGFSGTWSNYPFFESGTIIVNSGSEGLFILKKKDSAVF